VPQLAGIRVARVRKIDGEYPNILLLTQSDDIFFLFGRSETMRFPSAQLVLLNTRYLSTVKFLFGVFDDLSSLIIFFLSFLRYFVSFAHHTV
jgi:hypothetical protein